MKPRTLDAILADQGRATNAHGDNAVPASVHLCLQAHIPALVQEVLRLRERAGVAEEHLQALHRAVARGDHGPVGNAECIISAVVSERMDHAEEERTLREALAVAEGEVARLRALVDASTAFFIAGSGGSYRVVRQIDASWSIDQCRHEEKGPKWCAVSGLAALSRDEAIDVARRRAEGTMNEGMTEERLAEIEHHFGGLEGLGRAGRMVRELANEIRRTRAPGATNRLPGGWPQPTFLNVLDNGTLCIEWCLGAKPNDYRVSFWVDPEEGTMALRTTHAGQDAVSGPEAMRFLGKLLDEART